MKKFLSGFVHAFNGIRKAFQEQRNVKVQVCCGVAVIISGFYFHISMPEWIIVLVMNALVISLELVNTAIENLVDLITIERKPLAGKIKDIAAGAVLLSAFVSVIVGFLIFSKYIF